MAILCYKQCVIFTLPSIGIETGFIAGDIAEENGDPIGQGTDPFPEADTFPDIIRLVPNISDEISRNRQFRKYDDVAVLLFCLGYAAFHRLYVPSRVTGMDVQLGECYFQHEINLPGTWVRFQLPIIVPYFTGKCISCIYKKRAAL